MLSNEDIRRVRMFVFCLYRTRNYDFDRSRFDRDDLMQEVLLAVWMYRQKKREGQIPHSLMYYRAIDFLRSPRGGVWDSKNQARDRDMAYTRSLDQVGEEGGLDNLRFSDKSSEDAVRIVDQESYVRSIFENYPGQLEDVLAARLRYEGHSINDVATTLGRSRRHIQYGLARFRAHMTREAIYAGEGLPG